MAPACLHLRWQFPTKQHKSLPVQVELAIYNINLVGALTDTPSAYCTKIDVAFLHRDSINLVAMPTAPQHSALVSLSPLHFVQAAPYARSETSLLSASTRQHNVIFAVQYSRGRDAVQKPLAVQHHHVRQHLLAPPPRSCQGSGCAGRPLGRRLQLLAQQRDRPRLSGSRGRSAATWSSTGSGQRHCGARVGFPSCAPHGCALERHGEGWRDMAGWLIADGVRPSRLGSPLAGGWSSGALTCSSGGVGHLLGTRAYTSAGSAGAPSPVSDRAPHSLPSCDWLARLPQHCVRAAGSCARGRPQRTLNR